MKSVFAVLFGVFSCVLGWGQQELRILGAYDSIPLPGAHIYDSVSGTGYITNKEGRAFKPEKKGLWSVSYLGYQTVYFPHFEKKSEVFLIPEPRALQEVSVYGLDLMQLLRSNLAQISLSDPTEGDRHLVLRIVSRTNNQLSQLIQTQLIKVKQDLWLSSIDFAKLPNRKEALSGAGYLEVSELIHRTDPAYPLRFLLQFLGEHSIEDVHTDANTSVIRFSGILSDKQGQHYSLQNAQLIVDMESRSIRKLEWQIAVNSSFENNWSSRYRKPYALAYKRISEKYTYNLKAKAVPQLIEAEAIFSILLKQGKHIDSVLLRNHVLLPSRRKAILILKKPFRKLKTKKPLLDQLKNVPLKEQKFLLTQEEQKFITGHDE